MHRKASCSVCSLLLEELSAATTAHIKLDGQHKTAVLQHGDSASVLEASVLNAAERRAIARRTYHEHAGGHTNHD